MDRRFRIVLDTNVLVSAAIKPEGQQALVVYLVALGAVELFASAEIPLSDHPKPAIRDHLKTGQRERINPGR